MSSYGVAVVIDVQDAAAWDAVLARVAALDGRAWVAPIDAPWRRVTAYLREVELLDVVAEWLADAGVARAAVADDYDEYGALWVVLANDGTGLRTVHRRWVLNADLDDPDSVEVALSDLGYDPRPQDVAGAEAAAAAAAVFEVDAAPVLAAEAGSDKAHERIGTIGGPFPWWDALALPWPQEGVGESVG